MTDAAEPHGRSLDGPPSTPRTPFVRAAGLLCLLGGVIGVASALVTGFIPAAVAPGRYSYPYTPTGFLAAQLVFILNHLLLLVGLLGLWRSDATGSHRFGRGGLWVSLAGMGLLTLCEVAAMTMADAAYPSPPTDALGTWFGMASILIGAGLVTAGIAVVRARVWTGWRRFLPLACGVAVFAIVIPGVFGPFLAGRLALAIWMLMFTALGAALLRADTASR